MTTEEIQKWKNPLRKAFHLFHTVEEELSVGKLFWRNRTAVERLEYLEFMRRAIYGEEVVTEPMIRCYGWRKFNEDADPENIVYF
jgi:hypothetical protein